MADGVLQNRYCVETIESEALKKNPLKVSNIRKVSVYLPPSYYENTSTKFPVIYLLHGYGGSFTDLIVGTKADFKRRFPFILRLLLRKVFNNLLTFEKLDALILAKQLPPFILVQPDASLTIPDMFKTKNPDGSYKMKGSFYVNSVNTGKYNDFVFDELISHIEQRYRIEAQKTSRSLIGGSMGGYGAILGGMQHPGLFHSVVALSPLITPLNLFNVEMIVPIYHKIYGKKKAMAMGQNDIDDIRDSVDMIFSPNSPLVPTMIESEGHSPKELNPQGFQNWQSGDLLGQLPQFPSAFQNVDVFLNCDLKDEFNFSPEIREFSQALQKRNIPHEVDIYEDFQVERISPHMLGIGKQVLPAITRCLHNSK